MIFHQFPISASDHTVHYNVHYNYGHQTIIMSMPHSWTKRDNLMLCGSNICCLSTPQAPMQYEAQCVCLIIVPVWRHMEISSNSEVRSVVGFSWTDFHRLKVVIIMKFNTKLSRLWWELELLGIFMSYPKMVPNVCECCEWQMHPGHLQMRIIIAIMHKWNDSG